MTLESKTVQLFVTCLVDKFYPEVGFAVVALLEGLGFAVQYQPAQTCCGQPAFNGGFLKEAQHMARHTIDVLSKSDAPVIIPSGSCGDMIIHRYAEILSDDTAYAERASAVASRTYELTQFLVDELKVERVGVACNGRFTYHPSCHGLRGLGLREQPRTLLANAEPNQQVELPDAESCCGFGGLFAVKMSDISGEMLNKKLDNVEASGADVLVGGDVSCLMHMAGGLHRRGSKIAVKHLAEILQAPTPPSP